MFYAVLNTISVTPRRQNISRLPWENEQVQAVGNVPCPYIRFLKFMLISRKAGPPQGGAILPYMALVKT